MDGLVIGLDLNDDYTQICCYDKEKSWTIPTVICRRKEEEVWLSGEEAYAATLLGEGVIVDKLLKMAAKDGTSTIGGICYGGGTLLKLFIEKMLGYPRKEFGTDEVAQLVITLQSVDCRLLDTLMYCADYLEIPRDRVHVISHTEGFIYYVLSQKKAAGKIPEDGQVIKSIVSTNLIDAVAREYGCELIEVLTGFKWIGQQVLKNEKTGHGTYLFGMEESYGCLIGTYARDKDAISATAALCEAAAYYKQKGMTLWDAMVAMYEKYGYYKDSVKSIGLSGIEGLAKIQSIMETLRNNTPAEVGGYKVVSARDYKLDTIRDMETGAVKPTGLPASNVLYYDLEDGAWICVRPSGTEPKIKFYFGVKGTSLEDADQKEADLGAAVMAMVDKMM